MNNKFSLAQLKPLYPTIYQIGKSTQTTHKCLKHKRPQSEMILLAIPALISTPYRCSVSYLSGILFLYCPVTLSIKFYLFTSLILSNEIISHYQHSHYPSRSDCECYSHSNSLMTALPPLWSLLISPSPSSTMICLNY